MSCRLVVLGGSAVSTVQLIDALAAWPGGQARRPDGLELVLHGRSWRLAGSLTPAGCEPAARPGCKPGQWTSRIHGNSASPARRPWAPAAWPAPSARSVPSGRSGHRWRTVRARRSSSTSPTWPTSSSGRRGLRSASASSPRATRRSACSTALPAGAGGASRARGGSDLLSSTKFQQVKV
jgi:hypothetical protein